MKSYSDLEQSKKLADILPIESADMCFENGFPCWSIGALLDIIPYPTLGKHADETWSCTSWVEKVNPYFVECCDSPINACFEMILKLHEEKLL